MSGKQKVFLDTSVFSAYLDERQPERMALTQESWEKLRNFSLYTSEVTRQELEVTTNTGKRKKFRTLLKEINVLGITKDAESLARKYTKSDAIPEKFVNDALQIATATVNGIQLMLSWNFRHMVNQKVKARVNAINTGLNYQTIEIAAPAELL